MARTHKLIGASTIAVMGVATVFVAATARKVKANRAEWSKHGFYGFPVHAKATSSSGKKHKVTLTSSRIEPSPEASEEWAHAAKAVLRSVVPR